MNPHRLPLPDFESGASTIPPLRHGGLEVFLITKEQFGYKSDCSLYGDKVIVQKSSFQHSDLPVAKSELIAAPQPVVPISDGLLGFRFRR